MVLRGIASRRLISLTIVVLTVLVVSGTVVAIAFSGVTGVSRGSAGVVVLLGFVALTSQSLESVRRREPELALARLRGRRGLRLLTFTVAEPFVVVLVGALLGVGVGWVVSRAVVGAWLPAGTTVGLGHDEWTGAVAVTAGSLLMVLASSWQVLRTPLVQQLAGAPRPRAVTTVGLFLQLLLVLGAVVSIYQAHQAVASRVDWVTLVSPAVVGLAAGQLLIWLVMALLAVAVPHNGQAGVGWFLTLRRLLRRADSLALVRIVVAAGVVFGVATSASSAATTWRVDRAKLQVGAPVSYPVPAGALRAYAAARVADPQGRWLVPVAAYVTSTEGDERRVFVDGARWQAVLGSFYDGTPSSELGNRLPDLSVSAPFRYATGAAMTATVESSSLVGSRAVTLTFQYVNDAGGSSSATLRMPAEGGVGDGNGLTRFTGRVQGCSIACSLIEVDISGLTQTPRAVRPPLTLVDATFAGERTLGPAAGIHLLPGQPGLHVARAAATLVVRMTGYTPSDSWVLGSFGTTAALPAIGTGGFTYLTEGGRPTIPGIDGSARAIHVVDTMAVLPFVGTRGSLLDLGSVLAGAGGTIPETHAVVLARTGAPSSVLDALRASGSTGRPTSYAGYLTTLGATPQAQGTRLYVLVAGFAGLIALVGIASAVAQQTRERRKEAASLRSVGVPVRAINGAYRREALVLALMTFLGTTVAAWLACRVLLPALPLVSGWPYAPPLDAAPHLPFIALAALGSAVVVGLTTFVAFRGLGRTSPPRILREEVT